MGTFGPSTYYTGTCALTCSPKLYKILTYDSSIKGYPSKHYVLEGRSHPLDLRCGLQVWDRLGVGASLCNYTHKPLGCRVSALHSHNPGEAYGHESVRLGLKIGLMFRALTGFSIVHRL